MSKLKETYEVIKNKASSVSVRHWAIAFFVGVVVYNAIQSM